jgi:predicted porin
MKKTLIALAAVAVSSAAMAQVTLSGKLAYGWETASNAAGATVTKGLKVTDGNFTLATSEDLGGGMTIAAKMDMLSRGRSTDVSARDASITVSGGFGAVTIGAIEAGNGIIGLGGAGAPVIGLDGNRATSSAGTAAIQGSAGVAASTRNNGVLDAAGNVDIIAYTLPVGNGLTLTVNRTDTPGTGEGANPGTTFGAVYSAGALNAKIDSTDSVVVKRTRFSASYNLGMATVGYGYQSRKASTVAAEAAAGTGTNKQQIVGVSVPMGALTFGVNFASGKNTLDGNLDNKGTDLGVSYALSKRTTFYVQNQSVTVGTAASAKTTRVKLMHSF